MATRRAAFDDKLARIAALADASPAAATPELRRHLADPSGYLAGEAARVAAKLALHALVPDLAAAFQRLLADPLVSDKGCAGKKRIVEALIELEARAPEVYLRGLRHFQPEPAFGRPVDSASPLRSLCAHALVQFDHPDAVLEVAPLLADPEPDVRAEAASALGNSGEPLCGAILHVKVLAGDKEADVIGACYRALLRLGPRRYLPVVAAALRGGEDEAEVAALALGESRLGEALAVLEGALASGRTAAVRETVLLGIALLRSDEANEKLLARVETAPEAEACAALAALALHRHDEKIAARAREIVARRGSRKLRQTLDEKFGR